MLPQYQGVGTIAAGIHTRKEPCSYDMFGLPELQPCSYDTAGAPELQLRTYAMFGLPALRPGIFQSTLLSQVRMEDLQRQPELAEPAYASCMKWFVDTVTSAKEIQEYHDHPAISRTVMSPYLQLISKSAWTLMLCTLLL